MVEDPRTLVHRLLRTAYHPFDGDADLVRCFAGIASAATQSSWTEVSLSSRSAGRAPLLVLYGSPRDTVALSRDFPVRYRKVNLGRLSVPLPVLPLLDSGSDEACRLTAETLAFHLKRQDFRELAREELDRDLSLIGTSLALGRVDHFIEHASQTALPGLLLGDAGSEVERVAVAIHLADPDRQGAFVQVNSATLEGASFEEQWLRHLRAANHGTLVIAHLDGMALRSQHLLCQILESGLAGWAAQKTGQPFEVRLLGTGSRQLAGLAETGLFSARLLALFDILHHEVEPLRERPEDIAPLIEHGIRLHRSGLGPQVSAEVLEICTGYGWPGDISELSRVAARLAVMTEEGPILVRHVHEYAPQILAVCVRPSPASKTVAALIVPLALPVAVPVEVVLAVPVPSRHPALARAIDFIGANFDRKLPMAEVAAGSFVSGSHLAHLFQQGLGTSFTNFLTDLRIERAKKLLLSSPCVAITLIAGNVGFSDLRHFERTFKTAVGCTPKMFRWRSAARGASPQKMP